MKNEGSYECAICMETAKEPVVTRCGHLYCWPCIYDWFETKSNNAECPICKNPISKENLIPIYTKEENSSNTNRFKIPNRPKGERNEESRNNNNQDNNTNQFFQNFNFFGSFGFFPFFGFNMTWNGNGNNNNNSFNNTFNRNNSFSSRSNIPNMRNETKMAWMHLATLVLMVYLYAIYLV